MVYMIYMVYNTYLYKYHQNTHIYVCLTGSISVYYEYCNIRVLEHIIFDDSSFYLVKYQVLIDMVPTKHTSSR